MSIFRPGHDAGRVDGDGAYGCQWPKGWRRIYKDGRWPGLSKARTLDDVLGPIAALKTTRAKGDAFERLTKWFLENDPVLGKRFEKVEMWKKWKHNDGQDTGIDLVATEKDGTWCAIQCKYHEDRTQTVHQSEVKGLVAKAESLSKKHKSQTRLEDHSLAARVEALSKKHKREMHLMFVHSGGDLSSNATKMLRDANCSVIGYHDLRSSHIQDWSLDRRAARAERQDLREHQKEALSSVVGGFKGADRGQLIMACGTGKTRTAMTIAEKMVGGGGGRCISSPPSRSSTRLWTSGRGMPTSATTTWWYAPMTP